MKTIEEFFENAPPNQVYEISEAIEFSYNYGYILKTPEIQLHCSNEDCNGIRFFRCISDKIIVRDENIKKAFIEYTCSNCQKNHKTFAILLQIPSLDEKKGFFKKIGEEPQYGPQTSPKLIKLIGPDREIFLKGRQCENHGLGIGSFIYYRRVVENQKDRILKKIIQVADKIGGMGDKIKVLENAINETQFTKALDMTKDALPESLLINGHNPLTLLHGVLSEGVHALTDEKCLEYAGSVRVVLGELSERLGQALKDEAELNKALSTIMNRK